MFTTDWGDGSAAQNIAGPDAVVAHVYASAPTGPIYATATDDTNTYDADYVCPDLLPAAPTTLAGTAVSGQEVNLAWTDHSGIEDGFLIEQAEGSGDFAAVAFAPASTTAAPATVSYTLTGPFHPSTAYHFRVSALSGSTLSDPTTVLTLTTLAVPEYVTNMTVTAISQAAITLTWDDQPATGDVYTIQRSSDNGTSWTSLLLTPLIPPVSPATTYTYPDTGLDGNTVYMYRVYATNVAGESGYAEDASVTAAVAPTTVTATAISPTKVEVSWSASTGTAATVYNVYQSTDPNYPGTCVAEDFSELSWVCDSLTAGIKYYFRVEADNPALLPAMASASPDATPLPPDAPTDFSVSDSGLDWAEVHWTDNSTGEDGFEIEASVDNSYFWQVLTAAPDVTAATIDELSPQTQYYFRIRSVQDGVGSDWTGPLTLTTNPEPPQAPVSLYASSIGTTSLDLAWTDGSDCESGFEVEYSANGLDFTAAADSPLAANTTSYAISGLDDGRKYTVRVRAVNVSGPSDWCAVNFTTHLIAPGSLSATALSPYQTQLAWTKNSTAPDCAFAIETPWTTIYTTVGATSWIIKTTPNRDSSSNFSVSMHAVDGLGTPANSAASSVSVVVPQLGVPDAPTNLHVITRSGNLTPFLAWDYGGLPNDITMVVQMSLHSDFQPSFSVVGTGGSAVRALEVAPNSTYTTYYRVVVENSAGDSGFSNVVSLAAASCVSVHPDISAAAVSEAMEDLSGAPGLIIPANDHDTATETCGSLFIGDGIPDFADGYGGQYGTSAEGHSQSFTALSIDVSTFDSTEYDKDYYTITFNYTASNPLGITRTADGHGGYTYTPDSAGRLRLWTLNGPEARSAADILSSGDYITPGTAYTIRQLIDNTDAADESGHIRRLYVEGVSASGGMADQHITITTNTGGTDTLNLTVAGVNLTAHRTGLNFGQAVTEQTEAVGNPADFVVLVNNDEEEDPLGLRKDNEDDMAKISSDGHLDDDIVKITLSQLPSWLTSGLVQVILVGDNPNPFRVFNSAGLDITQLFRCDEISEDSPCLAMDLAALQGPLAGLKTGDVDLWFEGLGTTTRATVLYQVQALQGQSVIAGDDVRMAIRNRVDLAIDSDNNNGFGLPDQSAREDAIEDDPNKPGKVIPVNDGDCDRDGVPDYADGYNWDGITDAIDPPTPDVAIGHNADNIPPYGSQGEHFTPIVVQLSDEVDWTKVRLQSTYDFSNPNQVTRTGSGTAWDPYLYSPAPGTL
ncbi:MAG: fibronectin type III domain-containing protein, partial [Tepidisphaeraceae bacterium]